MSAVAGDSKRIRVAVVGTGEFGRNHARVYRELEGVELVGVYDKSAGCPDSLPRSRWLPPYGNGP